MNVFFFFFCFRRKLTPPQMDASTHRGSISRSYGKIFFLVFFYSILIFLLFLFWCVLYIFIQAELVEIWQTD
jgi:hypothetical protein